MQVKTAIIRYRLALTIRAFLWKVRFCGSFTSFRLPGYDHLQKDQRRPFDSHVVQYVLIGYPIDFTGWRVWDPNTKNEIVLAGAVSANAFPPITSLAYS